MTIEDVKTEYRDLVARLGENLLKKEAIEKEDMVIRRRIEELESIHRILKNEGKNSEV